MIAIFASSFSSAVAASSNDSLTVYSTRKEHLIEPLFDAFTKKLELKLVI